MHIDDYKIKNITEAINAFMLQMAKQDKMSHHT